MLFHLWEGISNGSTARQKCLGEKTDASDSVFKGKIWFYKFLAAEVCDRSYIAKKKRFFSDVVSLALSLCWGSLSLFSLQLIRFPNKQSDYHTGCKQTPNLVKEKNSKQDWKEKKLTVLLLSASFWSADYFVSVFLVMWPQQILLYWRKCGQDC